MMAGWVAAGVRARALTRRRMGFEGARRLAARPTLDEAIDVLSLSPYRREVQPEMDLSMAQRAIGATLLWHLRIMAGWCPPLDPTPVRLLAGGFEIANVVGHLLRCSGGPSTGPPFELGSLATAWPAVSAARTAPEVRLALARSAWGDPGTDDVGGVNLYLRLRWAMRVYQAVPEAARWAGDAADLITARAPSLHPAVAQGGRARPARRPASTEDRRGPERWRSESLWWQSMERSAADLAARPPHGPAPVVGAVGLLAADAWRVRAGLALAAGGGGDLREVAGVA